MIWRPSEIQLTGNHSFLGEWCEQFREWALFWFELNNSRFVEILNFRMLKIRMSIGEVHFMFAIDAVLTSRFTVEPIVAF